MSNKLNIACFYWLLSKVFPTKAVRSCPFTLHVQSCLLSAVFHTHVKIENFNRVPFDFEQPTYNISTVSVHRSRLRVGQYFVARFLCDNVKMTTWKQQHGRSGGMINQ